MVKEALVSVGRSDYGITILAEHSSISLAQIICMFLSVFPYGNGVAIMQYVNNWVDIIRDIYFKIHDEFFPDDKPF